MATRSEPGFINRSMEVDVVLQQVAELRSGVAAQKCLVNIYGVYGIGKTALLKHLAERISSFTDLRMLRIEIPALAPGEKAPSAEAKLSIIRQLHDDSQSDGPTLRDVLAADVDKTDSTGDTALERYAQLLLSLRQPIVLLINAENSGAPAAFVWLERGLLKLLVNAHRLVAIITSRKEILWREFDTRNRANSLTLSPFTLVRTAEQLAVAPEGAAAIFALTRGLPLANELAQHMLMEAPDPQAWSVEQQVTLIRDIRDAIYARIGPELTSQLCCILEVLAVVREFEVLLMHQLVNRFCVSEGLTQSQGLILGHLRQLTQLDLVNWSTTYQVAPTLRPLLANFLRRTEPDRYRTIRAAACERYRSPDRGQGTLIREFIELLWHTLDQDVTDDAQARAAFASLLHEILLPPGSHYSPTIRAAVVERLQADHEIVALLEVCHSSVGSLLVEFDRYVVRFNANT